MFEPLCHAGREFLLQQDIDVAQDHHQDVVEVVRDPAGQLPDDFHPLRPHELALERKPIPDILSHRQIGGPALEIDQTDGHFHVHHGAVLPAVSDPLEGPLGVEAVLAPPLLHGRHLFRRVMVVDGHRKMFLLRPAILLHRRLVDRDEAQRLLIRHEHGIGTFVEQHAVAVVRGAPDDDFARELDREPCQRRSRERPADRHEPSRSPPHREHAIRWLRDG